jgi:hypothetical protein
MPVSLNAVSTAFGGTGPHGLKELYGVAFGSPSTFPSNVASPRLPPAYGPPVFASPASGVINLNSFEDKVPYVQPTTQPTSFGTTNINYSINESTPLVYNLGNQEYTLNIAGYGGPQAANTAQASVQGIDINQGQRVTLRIYDSRYSGYSQIKFAGNYLFTVTGTINARENNEFNSRFGFRTSALSYVTANNIFNASAVVSWYIPIPVTASKLEFFGGGTAWNGYSITI